MPSWTPPSSRGSVRPPRGTGARAVQSPPQKALNEFEAAEKNGCATERGEEPNALFASKNVHARRFDPRDFFARGTFNVDQVCRM